MGVLCNPTIAIQFTCTKTGTRVLVGPFIHAAFMCDLVRATRVGNDNDEIVAECDGENWYHANRPYTDFEIVPWMSGVTMGELAVPHGAANDDRGWS